MTRYNIIVAATAALVFAGAVHAATAPIDLQTIAQKEESFVDAQGETRTRLVPVTTVVPGDQVVYTLTFANRGEQPVTGVTVVDPIPEQMRYVNGSAFGPGTDIAFSVDDGASFAPAEELLVTDASGAERAARADDFTHIRWVFRGELEPGAQGYARFRAVLD